MMRRLHVSAPLIVVRRAGGGVVHKYEGETIHLDELGTPADGLDYDDVQRLIRDGWIKEDDP